jgi:hypothetical protein
MQQSNGHSISLQRHARLYASMDKSLDSSEMSLTVECTQHSCCCMMANFVNTSISRRMSDYEGQRIAEKTVQPKMSIARRHSTAAGAMACNCPAVFDVQL